MTSRNHSNSGSNEISDPNQHFITTEQHLQSHYDANEYFSDASAAGQSIPSDGNYPAAENHLAPNPAGVLSGAPQEGLPATSPHLAYNAAAHPDPNAPLIHSIKTVFLCIARNDPEAAHHTMGAKVPWQLIAVVDSFFSGFLILNIVTGGILSHVHSTLRIIDMDDSAYARIDWGAYIAILLFLFILSFGMWALRALFVKIAVPGPIPYPAAARILATGALPRIPLFAACSTLMLIPAASLYNLVIMIFLVGLAGVSLLGELLVYHGITHVYPHPGSLMIRHASLTSAYVGIVMLVLLVLQSLT